MNAQLVLVDEINENTFKNISEQEKEILVSDLELFGTEVLGGLKKNSSVIHKMFFSSQKDIFQHWAESLEKLHYLGVYEEPIHTISTHIRKQIGRCTFDDNIMADVVKHDQLFDSMKHSIHERFKDPDHQHRGKESPENTSVLELTPDHTFLLEGLQMFKHYHRRFADIADDFISKLEDPIVYKDFADVTEWQEIGLFSHYLNEISSEFGLLDQIEDEINVKESATLLQKAMLKIEYADGAFRQMAGKFGVSPRQCQRIRQRLDDWPLKEAQRVIMKIIGSQVCPCGCGYNFITQKKYQSILNPKFFPKYRWSEKKIKLPGSAKEILEKNDKLVLSDNVKNKRLNPIDIAAKIWGKKTKLVLEKFEEKESKKLEKPIEIKN